MTMVDRYGVVGNPVAHSLSPEIHEAFALQTGESLSYERIEAPLDGFADTVADFLGSGGRGVNVTVPFKGEAAAWVDRLAANAAAAVAVNTIVPDPAGGWVGHNTDGPGLVLDLDRLLPESGDLSVLMLGAGGAARGVAAPLLDGPAASLTIANRTPAKAVELAARLQAAGYGSVRGTGFDDLSGAFDLVVNATSTGLDGALPAVSPSLLAGAFCYDMVYGASTPFCRWAADAGASGIADGLGMLVGQAALAFELWRGIRPDTLPVLTAIRSNLAGGAA